MRMCKKVMKRVDFNGEKLMLHYWRMAFGNEPFTRPPFIHPDYPEGCTDNRRKKLLMKATAKHEKLCEAARGKWRSESEKNDIFRLHLSFSSFDVKAGILKRDLSAPPLPRIDFRFEDVDKITYQGIKFKNGYFLKMTMAPEEITTAEKADRTEELNIHTGDTNNNAADINLQTAKTNAKKTPGKKAGGKRGRPSRNDPEQDDEYLDSWLNYSNNMALATKRDWLEDTDPTYRKLPDEKKKDYEKEVVKAHKRARGRRA